MSRLVKLLVTSEPLGHKSDIAMDGGDLDARYSYFLEEGGLFMNAGEIEITNENAIIGNWTRDTQTRLKDLMEEMTSAAAPNFEDYELDLGSIGAVYHALIPEKVNAFIRALPEDPVHYIYIHTANHWIPWELIYDNEESFFWGERFIIVRVPMLEFSSRQSKRSVLTSTPRTLAKVMNVVGDEVAENLHSADPAQLALDLLANRTAHFDGNYSSGAWQALSVAAVKNRGCDASILHFTCHGRWDGDSGYYLQLHATPDHPTSYRLDALKVQSHLRLDDTLVFVNACTSDVQALHYGTFMNMGQQFFESGAGTFIGTIAPVPIDEAIKLAAVFYEKLLAGEPVGIALHEAKKAMKEQRNPFYLFYCIYGNAYKRFRPVEP